MARITNAQVLDAITSLAARIDAIEATPVATPARTAEASAHWKARDLPCSAVKPCDKVFRTVKGRDWHVANVKHA